jgi:tetratricopeptide (TPR) repeat protein
MAQIKEIQAPGAGNPLWIYNPWLDLVVGCGAWSAPLLLITYFARNSSTLAWSVAFYGLALFFNYPHYMATLYRAYHRAEDFERYRIFTVHITALVALTLVLSHFWFAILPWIFTLYLTLSPWHYSGQNYGLFMMFARRAGAKPSNVERQALYAAFLISYGILFLSFHTGPSNDPLFISIGLPGRVSTLIVMILALAFVATSAFGLSRLAGQVGWRPLMPAITLFSTQFLWFLLPTALSLGERLQIPQSRYSSGVLAVMHAAQYLWITSYYARREACAEQTGRWRPWAYFGVLIAGGIALFVPGPWLASRVFHRDFGASFLIFTALVNLHHFILDGAIWKLREGRIAAMLLDTRERVSSATAQAGSQVAASFRWLVGSSTGARALRVSTAVLLVGWGTVDQVRYYLALHDENVTYLQRAAALNAYDSSLQMHLGQKEVEAGKMEQAAAAWRQAVRSNPSDPAPRNQLLKYLTGQKRFQEAYQLTHESLQHTPKDPDLLVNNGILASQLGHHDEAAESWKKAIVLDSSQLYAHLYLAGELDRDGKAEAAIPHYMTYLDQITQHPDKARPQEVIAIVLRLADCQVQAKRTRDAEQAYALAMRIASQTGERRLESFAAIGGAQLEAALNKKADALRLYQQALKLDGPLNDPRSEAADWYGYAIFLRNAGFPERLAYACLLKSESLMQSLKDAPDMTTVIEAREDLGKKLAAQADAIRRNPQPAIDEAMAITVK